MTRPTTHHAPRRKKRPTRKPEAPPIGAPSETDSTISPKAPFIEPERRHAMISDAAYFLSERRDFCAGHEIDDWLTAERDIEHLLNIGQPGSEREI